MQAHAPVKHGHKSDRQHQRNGDGHHHARPDVDAQRLGVQAQGDEADRQHDHHRLDQHLDEFIHRASHSPGLILNLLQLNTGRQLGANARGRCLQGLAHGHDVAPLGHGHTQRNHVLALMPHHDRRRVSVASRDLGNIRQAQAAGLACRWIDGANRKVLQRLHRLELSLHPHLQIATASIQNAAAFDCVLRADLGNHLIEIQAQGGHPLLRDLDKHLLGLYAEGFDLGHIRYLEQSRAYPVSMGTQLLKREALRRERKNAAVDITELVIEDRPHHALRQGVRHVPDPLTHLVPNIGYLGRRRVLLELKDSQRFTRLGIAAHPVGVRHLLQGFFDLVGDLLGHLFGRGTGPKGLHHHHTKRKGRVLILAELEIGSKAHQHENDQEVARQRRMFQGPARDVEIAAPSGARRLA